MRRILRWVVGAPLFIAVMFFAVANRRWVSLSLDPINDTNPALALDMPLWLLLFLGIFIGILVGWFFCWRAQGKWRRLARDRQREIERLQNEMRVARDGPEKVQAQMLAPTPRLHAMKLFSAADLAALAYGDYVEALREGFKGAVTAPPRFVSGTVPHTTFFAMPAWRDDFTGIKTITLKSDNAALGLPTIQGTYQLFDNATGAAVALFDGTELTRLRTAAASALAADFLARRDAETLLVGAGALAPHFAKAMQAVRGIKRILIFNRTPEKAVALAKALGGEAVRDVAAACSRADIISCITSGHGVVVKGEWLKPGTHVDLVGAYKPEMREVDAAAVSRARVYVDTREGALHEAGDLHCAAQEGRFDWADLQGDLHDLCRGQVHGRRTEAEITLFKSSGTALEDLAAARMVYLRS